ncbi:transposase [Chitinophaga sancti]|uniref:IS66 family insertion sequence element accessory protein TnpA n=1 Tax=Chitinophaga sancti TaxID=1004 RepID=UPI002A75D528|nr:transposase [Chitinophaga sancti]WPQ63351.1 transposase [Chitinophaga sancti]
MASSNTTKNVRKQRSATQIRQLLRDFDNSEGLSVRDYCERIGVSDGTFYYWRKKYGEFDNSPSHFIPLEITGLPPRDASVQIEVKIIKLYGHSCIEQLKAILL